MLVAFVLRAGLAGGAFYQRDLHLLWHPQAEAFVRAVAAGSWPVWDPARAFGQPMLADGLAQVLYPFTWLHLIVRPWTYYTVYAVAHVFLSSAGALVMARRLGLPRTGALVAAALWTVSGPLLSLVDLWHHLAGASLMPWALLAADTALASGRWPHALRWGAVVGLQVLAGSTDMCAATAVFTVAIALGRLEWKRSAAAATLRMARSAALAAAVGLALSAALWMPALDVASRSDRAALSREVRTYWSVHPAVLPQTVLAGLWTNVPLRADWRAALFESREPLLASLYLGLPAFALVGAAVASGRTRLQVPLLVMLAACVLVALGRHAPVYDGVVAVVPALRMLRFPVKAMVPAALAWSLLAGFGYDAWTRRQAVPRRAWTLAVIAPLALLFTAALAGLLATTAFAGQVGRWLIPPDAATSTATLLRPASATFALQAALAAVALALAVARLRAPHRGPETAAALALVAVVDLSAGHRNLQPVAPTTLYTYRPDVVRAIDAMPHARVYAYDYTRAEALAHLKNGMVLARIPEGWKPEAALALAMQMHLAPSTAARWAIPTGYDIDYRGLYSRDLARLTTLLRAAEGTPAHTHLLRLGGVSHVVALHTDGLEGLRTVGEYPGLFSDPARLFAVPDPLPRTYAVGASRVARGSDALSALLSSDLDPARQVVLAGGTAASEPVAFRGTSRIVTDAPDRVRLEATLTAPGYVVLLDGYDPGWTARVDGRRADVLQANVAFRAVAVPAGTHAIEYRYRPRSLVRGLWISAAALLALLLTAVASSLRHGRRPADARR